MKAFSHNFLLGFVLSAIVNKIAFVSFFVSFCLKQYSEGYDKILRKRNLRTFTNMLMHSKVSRNHYTKNRNREIIKYSFLCYLIRRDLCVPSCLTLYLSVLQLYGTKSKHLPFCLEIIILTHA